MSQQRNPYTHKPYTNAYHLMRQHAADLPVTRRMPQLLEAIRNDSVTIIIGETGSGKSTQVPESVLESLSVVDNRDVCLTQPRKLAAQSVGSDISSTLEILTNQPMKVAERIAKEMEVPLGDFVGFRHRDDDTTTDVTHLEVHTDGELHLDSSLIIQYKLTFGRCNCGIG